MAVRQRAMRKPNSGDVWADMEIETPEVTADGVLSSSKASNRFHAKVVLPDAQAIFDPWREPLSYFPFSYCRSWGCIGPSVDKSGHYVVPSFTPSSKANTNDKLSKLC